MVCVWTVFCTAVTPPLTSQKRVDDMRIAILEPLSSKHLREESDENVAECGRIEATVNKSPVELFKQGRTSNDARRGAINAFRSGSIHAQQQVGRCRFTGPSSIVTATEDEACGRLTGRKRPNQRHVVDDCACTNDCLGP